MLPILERLLFRPIQVATSRVLILVPTRELAIQVGFYVLKNTGSLSVELSVIQSNIHVALILAIFYSGLLCKFERYGNVIVDFFHVCKCYLLNKIQKRTYVYE